MRAFRSDSPVHAVWFFFFFAVTASSAEPDFELPGAGKEKTFPRPESAEVAAEPASMSGTLVTVESKRVDLAGTGKKHGPAGEISAEMPTVIVTATRRPEMLENLGGGIDVVFPDEIPGTVYTLADLLRNLPGIDIADSGAMGNKGTLNIRGLQGKWGTQRTLVLLDDMPLNDPYLGNVEMNAYTPAFIERVEVVRGPGSSLYGGTAVSGVVNMITRRGEGKPETEITGRGGEYNTGDLAVRHGAKRGGLDYLFTAEGRSTDGYMDTPDGHDRDYRSALGSARIGWELSPRDQLGLFTLVESSESELEEFHEKQLRANVNSDYRWEISPDTSLSMRAYYNSIDRTYEWKPVLSSSGALLQPAYNADYALATQGVQLQQTFPAGERQKFSLGAEARADSADVNELGGAIHETGLNASGRVQDEIDMGNDWGVIAGLRFDYDERFGGEFSPRAGVVKKITAGKLYVSVGKSYLAPKTSDLFLPPTSYMGMTFEGDPDLQPERHWGVEFGGEYRAAKPTMIRWAAFYDRGKDAWDYMMDTDFVFRPRNISETEVVGFETAADISLPLNLSVLVTYTWTRSRYLAGETLTMMGPVSIAGNRTEDIPEHYGSMTLRYSESDILADFTLRACGDRYADALNTLDYKLAPYAVADIAVRWRIRKNYAVSFTVQNLFNADYAESAWGQPPRPYPQPRRNVSVGFDISL